jgi:hypothetical protein
MNSNHWMRVAPLVLFGALAIVANAGAAELQSVLVRTKHDCWNDLREQVHPDSGMTLNLVSDERLVARDWSFYGSSLRRSIGVRLAPGSGDSLRIVPTAQIRSFEYRKRVATTPALRMFGAVAGGVAGVMLAGQASGGSSGSSAGGSDFGSIGASVGDAISSQVTQAVAGFAGLVVGGLIGYAIGDLFTPRTVQVRECACGEPAPPDSTGG